MGQQIPDGVYFFHRSFLIEVSETWLSKGEVGEAGELFMKIIFAQNRVKELITCDRTFEELSKSKYTLKYVPAVFDSINEKSLIGEEDLDDEEYAFKIASRRRITPHPVLFIVSDEEKDRIMKSARQKGYSLTISSPNDFD